MDPFTILGGLSAGIKAGKQLYSLKNQVTEFFDVVDEAKQKHSKKKNSIFDSIFSKSIDHIIYLYTDPEESLKRISRRSITDKFESRGLEYLSKLNKAYESIFSNMENVIQLNTSRDKEITKKDLLDKLKTIFITHD